MAIPFEVYTDHYALQWLKTMRTGSALLHRWSAALEEYDYTVRHRLGKVQTHVDGLSRLPVGPAPSEDTIFHLDIQDAAEARRLAQELHSATHLGGQALWKLFSDRYSHKAGRRICIEVAQSCPQCQRGSDYGHQPKTTGTIESKGPWDTLSVDIVGPLPADRRHEFIIVFVDCYSRFTILVPASNHTADTVSDALLRHVVPYFGTPRRLLSDRGREFVGEVWGKLTGSLGIQRVLTSPYHPEGNSINERSHRTHEQHAPSSLVERFALPEMGGGNPRHHACLECHGTRTPWLLGIHDCHWERAFITPRLRGQGMRLTFYGGSSRICRDDQTATLPHPPTDDPTSSS